MTTVQTGADIVAQTMAHLLPAKFDGAPARVLLLAIGMQESGFAARQQRGGPARSYWQFEQGGGIRGVLTHPTSKAWARAVCGLRAVAPVESDVYAAFLVDDQLACAFARLLLFTDPAVLPAVDDEQGAWEYYLRTWRPGDYDRSDADHRAEIRTRWAFSYHAAQTAVVS